MEDAILKAVLSFGWGNYGFDELEELATDDPDVGIFGNLAGHVYDAVLEFKAKN